MEYTLLILLLTVAGLQAAPVPDDDVEVTTIIQEPLQVIEIIGFVPIVVPLNEIPTTEGSEEIGSPVEHTVQKRSAAVPSEFLSNDLLENSEMSKLENSLVGFDRRIKILPSWVG
ncbi:unnamed protein product [Colias eurytheme]|nr:unnamed protein product [Colias eurytheme]